MRKSTFRRGMVLLQTLVISVILSMIAVMVLKWVLSRYMFAARNYRSSISKTQAGGFSNRQFSVWNINSVPSSGSQVITEPDGTQRRVCFCACPAGLGQPRRIVAFSNEDVPMDPCPACPSGSSGVCS